MQKQLANKEDYGWDSETSDRFDYLRSKGIIKDRKDT